MKKNKPNNSKILIILGVCALFLAILPLTLSAKSYLYVDDDASGEMDGTSSHPYDCIQEALDEAKKKDKDVFIREGFYEENIVIHSDIKVMGSGREEVIIKAHNKDEPVVEMHDDTTLGKVTVKRGKYGVYVKEDDSATITNCKIIDNCKDGIKAKRAGRKDKYELGIYGNYIAENGWNGIYSERRKAHVKNNEIYYNKKDGVEFEKKSELNFKDNRVKESGGVGLRLTIDESEIFVEDNTFYNNDKQGMEIRAQGAEGLIEVEDNKFYKNDSWGIVRIEAAPFCNAQWNNSFKILEKNIFWKNGGGISPVINVY